MKVLFILLIPILLCNSCLKKEYEDFVLPDNRYGNAYPDIKTVTFKGFSTQGVGQSCDLHLSFEIDTSGTYIHPDNIAWVLLFQNDQQIRTLPITKTSTVLANSCSKPKTFRFQLYDKEYHPVGQSTTAVWE
ncbi:MAG: hypothetical protein CL840_01650 [Crocinitomicaceae bacterium]|nr:hypothetical protein [Crocinitomicaceae bacterium]|tara:strand:- start:11912 stop:12307 length:396 start_codon:yes stop_codon:yes gene_type:complete